MRTQYCYKILVILHKINMYDPNKNNIDTRSPDHLSINLTIHLENVFRYY